MSTFPKLRVGLVGCGVVATAYYLPYLMGRADAEITAVCDANRARADACVRLFGAKAAYSDYYDMLRLADIDVVFILTGPGTHVPFALAAIKSGRHVLLQKPMALDLAGARAIHAAARAAKLKILVEPSDNTPQDPFFVHMRGLVRAGVLGDPYWFMLVPKGPEQPHPSLGGNPYGFGAFYAKDSGGILFDFPYAPSLIVSLLGSVKRVTALAKNSVPKRAIVPDSEYDRFLREATDPERCNYWEKVLDLPRSQEITAEAPDNVFCLFEMHSGWTGVFHTPRIFHPAMKGTGYDGFQAFGTEGNLAFGAGHRASIFSTRRHLLPEISEDGWYHVPTGPIDWSKAKWPIPPKGARNYYHESTAHLFDCVRDDREPINGVDWGLHITEIMYGAMESSRTGRHYDLETTVDW